MKRRDFLRYSTIGIASSSMLPSFISSASAVVDHPDVIQIQPNSDSIATDLQAAFEQAYQQWKNDGLSRRPIITLPAGTYYIDDIPNNNRGNYPFHVPPTFKLEGEGKATTRIICRQPTTQQYRFLMVRPTTRLDVLKECPSLNAVCVSDATASIGVAKNIEISGITFQDFDNVIGLQEVENCTISDCGFNGSMVSIELRYGDVFGNTGHSIANCEFNAQRLDGTKNRFCLRFEAPFGSAFTTTETGIPTLAECEALGGSVLDYNVSAQTCVAPDDELIEEYLQSMFGTAPHEDISNSQCAVQNCDFSNASYSAIEFAGKLNQFNQVTGCGFFNCEGTAIEFDKGASFNKVSGNLISGMKPTQAFAPAIPYIFQAAIQEQEGSESADARIKSYISEQGFDDVNNSNYKGDDIFYRAASLAQGNEIINNQFDVSRSYWIGQYETNTSRAAILPDVYPSIKLRKSRNTSVLNNVEFIGNASAAVTYSGTMGQSIVYYPDDNLRDETGGINIRGNKFYGALFVVGTANSRKHTHSLIIEDNDFGLDPISPRGGFSWNYLSAERVQLKNNRFLCSANGSSSVMQKLDIDEFEISGNTFNLSANNSFYMRSNTATEPTYTSTSIEHNHFVGGLAIAIYDWTGSVPGDFSQSKLQFSHNVIDGLSGSSKVVAVTLWVNKLSVNANQFNDFENKVFQVYGLSDEFIHDGQNTLNLGTGSQNRAYSRNYLNTSGSYLTNEFWA